MPSVIIRLALFFTFLNASTTAAQDALLARGDKEYADFSYSRAIETYEQAFKRNASSIPHARRLADSYWTLRDHVNAEKWYAVVAASSQATPQDVYRYAELLRTSGQFADSDRWMKRYAKLAPEDSRVLHKENATSKLAELLDGTGITHKVTLASFNSEFTELCPYIHDGALIFASSRITKYTSRDVHSWNDQPFLNLYSGSLDAEGNLTEVMALDQGLNTRYHESNAIISQEGKTMYFTRNNYQDGRKTLSEDGVNNLQIFIRQREGGRWTNESPFPHNSPAYSVGHPALSKDGERLYFTSDMSGGVGGKDIYVCHMEENGGWSEPENLGKSINTEGDEMFPYILDNVLYFASDGHLGLGGLDLFRTTIRGQGYGVVENLNAPVNSNADDFGICFDPRTDLAFFTSDRDGALGAENIYLFRVNSRPEDQRKWIGRVLDIADARPVPFLPIRMLDMERNELMRTVTSANGTYEFPTPQTPAFISTKIPGGPTAELAANEIEVSVFGDTDLPDIYLNSIMDLPVNAIIRDAVSDEWLDNVSVTVKDARDGDVLFMGYTNEQGIAQGQIPDRRFGDDMNIEVTFERSGYFPKTVLVDFRVLMFLEQGLTGPEGAGMSPVLTGTDMAKAMNLRPIYFDFREHRIRSDAAGELDLVAQVMRLDPSITIDLRSHTDSRASAEYNDALSQRRAESSRNYLIEQGIAATRITCKGYGERQLINACADGLECSEEEHQMNRRTEFIITSCSETATARPGKR